MELLFNCKYHLELLDSITFRAFGSISDLPRRQQLYQVQRRISDSKIWTLVFDLASSLEILLEFFPSVIYATTSMDHSYCTIYGTIIGLILSGINISCQWTMDKTCMGQSQLYIHITACSLVVTTSVSPWEGYIASISRELWLQIAQYMHLPYECIIPALLPRRLSPVNIFSLRCLHVIYPCSKIEQEAPSCGKFLEQWNGETGRREEGITFSRNCCMAL